MTDEVRTPELVRTAVAEIVRLLEQLPDEAARKAALADAGLFSACAGMPCPTFGHLAGRNISVCSVCPLPDRSGSASEGKAPAIAGDGFIGWRYLLMMLTSKEFPRLWQIVAGASVTVRLIGYSDRDKAAELADLASKLAEYIRTNTCTED